MFISVTPWRMKQRVLALRRYRPCLAVPSSADCMKLLLRKALFTRFSLVPRLLNRVTAAHLSARLLLSGIYIR
jgi:hypothetical protein